MIAVVLPALEGWDSFYVIIGSSAAALTGLMFVVIALRSDARVERDPAALEAFATPTIVHFCAVLLIGALLTMPRHSMESLRASLLICGGAGVTYATIVILRARRVRSYSPQLEDWIFHALLPVVAYVSLFIASVFLVASPERALLGVSASALLLLFTGIHNAWDAAVWMTTAGERMNEDERKIREVIDRWHRATKAGDLPSVLALMADDAIFLTPGRPPMTKDGFAAVFKKVSDPIKQDIKEIRVSRNLAYCWSHISVTMDAKTREGHVLTVFRKREDGSWVLSRDANLLTGGA